ncbi:hypothetical protein A5886_000430 [Enterococcus sp. 8G7_MSG3316]|uniref:VOC domain-containing protein n=1 Tax=Candidatus Enterococcus testudinis TaxID=1834191 RepID=A0A242A389_9ENTE|nr:VOC family protein [Enterococcus sp. 8G7_MSG3316]OTN75360.1 hypothetical protein A5886_000430 [Enterococcus sp. 8G7_MSG3316]
MTDFLLGSSTRLLTVAIRVKDRDQAIVFYRDVLGFELKREENELAIFGYKGDAKEILWLEESPRATDHTGEIKKMQRIVLEVATLAEAATIAENVQQRALKFEDMRFEDNQLGFTLADPEGNLIEVRYTAQDSETIPSNEADLINAAPKKPAALSAAVRFGKLYLHVSDLAKAQAFLENVLGLKTQEAEKQAFLLNDGDFQVGLTQAEGGTIDLPTHEVLGLDFLKISISQDDLDTLETHLTAENQEFFIDKKRKLLTTYDTIGIEWWFIVQKEVVACNSK